MIYLKNLFLDTPPRTNRAGGRISSEYNGRQYRIMRFAFCSLNNCAKQLFETIKKIFNLCLEFFYKLIKNPSVKPIQNSNQEHSLSQEISSSKKPTTENSQALPIIKEPKVISQAEPVSLTEESSPAHVVQSQATQETPHVIEKLPPKTISPEINSSEKSTKDSQAEPTIAEPIINESSAVSQPEPVLHTEETSSSNVEKSQATEEELEAQKVIDELTPQMVKALGGIEQVLRFPLLDDWDGEINIEDLTAPIMRGYYGEDCPFLIFCYLKCTDSEKQVEGEFLGKKDDKWEGAVHFPSELNLRPSNPISQGSEAEKYMLDKITRLMEGKAVGTLQKFPEVYLIKPKDKSSFKPDNAYLQEKDLLQYMDLDTLFYERLPKKDMTELFLYDPSKTQIENENNLKLKFPKMRI